MKDMKWVPVPNRFDSDGYVTLVTGRSGAANLGVWIAILEVASRCRVRGLLQKSSGEPHSCNSLATLTRIRASEFRRAIPILRSIGWLQVAENKGNPQAPAYHPPDRQPVTLLTGSEHPSDDRARKKGREENRKEQSASRTRARAPAREKPSSNSSSTTPPTALVDGEESAPSLAERKPVLMAWCEGHPNRPVYPVPADWQALRRLPEELTNEQLVGRVRGYLTDPDPFVADRQWPFPLFVTRVNQYRDDGSPPQRSGGYVSREERVAAAARDRMAALEDDPRANEEV